MTTQTVITLTPDELYKLMLQAATEAVANVQLKEQPVSKAEFKVLAGYKDEPAFREFCRANRIQPVEIRARKHFYLPSQLNGLQRPKGIHTTRA